MRTSQHAKTEISSLFFIHYSFQKDDLSSPALKKLGFSGHINKADPTK